jgi:hypothetical protein
MVKTDDRHPEERVAELLRLLPEAPPAWTQAAIELPRLRRVLDDLVARAERDAAFRDAVKRDLDGALRLAGYELDAATVAQLRRLLGGALPGPGA